MQSNNMPQLTVEQLDQLRTLAGAAVELIAGRIAAVEQPPTGA